MYQCIIAEIDSVRAHTNADRLQVATVLGYNVIVNLSVQVGDIVLLFPDDGQLSEEYATANDLVAYNDKDGNRKGGYFQTNRKVTVCRLRGERSEAFVAPLSSLSFTGADISKLRVGDEFHRMNDIPICNKYISTGTRKVKNSNKKKAQKECKFTKEFSRHLERFFPEHHDTAQFRLVSKSIQQGALITITIKLHGTSGRVAYIPVLRKLPWYKRLAKWLFFKDTILTKYTLVHGSRRVTLAPVSSKELDLAVMFTEQLNYRQVCFKQFEGKLRKNEIVFFEIVGFEETGRPIMSSVDTGMLRDRKFTERYGLNMTFSYGCADKECKLFVYRMALINPDGLLEELSWNRVKARCKEMGVAHVTEVCTFINDETVVGGMDLTSYVEYLTNGVDPSEPLDPSHISEGICIRVDHQNGHCNIYKNKNFAFKVLEGIIKDTGVVDTEELESLVENEME